MITTLFALTISLILLRFMDMLSGLQPWSDNYDTNNFVKYQRYREGSSEPDRSSPALPNSCLVIAEGTTYPSLTMGLGSVHPNCRVSHYGFVNDDANEGWLSSNWTSFNETEPHSGDEAINLNFRFDSLDAGAAVSFTWVYILRRDDLVTALEAVSVVNVVQPTTVASGTSVAFSATVSLRASLVLFTVSNSTQVCHRQMAS
jgi:hypothetical protein